MRLIAVTAVINVSAAAGRVQLIHYCREIGICPPVQRGTPLRGVGPHFGGWGAQAFPAPHPSKCGLQALARGIREQASASDPPSRELPALTTGG